MVWQCIHNDTTVYSQWYDSVFTTLWLCIHNDTTVNISTTIWPNVDNDMTVYWQWLRSVFTLTWCVHNDIIVYSKHYDQVFITIQLRPCVFTTIRLCTHNRIRPCIHNDMAMCVHDTTMCIHDMTMYSQRYDRVFTLIRPCIHIDKTVYSRLLLHTYIDWTENEMT